MSISPNSPQPAPPRQQRQSNLSWIFFLLILARPLWGILRAAIGPHVSDTQLWIVVGGVLALAALALLAPRALNRDTRVSRLPTGAPPVRLERPAPVAQRPFPGASPRAPRFEPIITGKVMLAGVVLLAMMSTLFLLLWLA